MECQDQCQSINLLQYGKGYNSIGIKYTPRAKLLEHEVRVAVKACSVRFLDLLVWQRIYERHNLSPPFIMGHECAGEVEEVGKIVKELKVKDRVMCWNFYYGMWAENICLPEMNCYKIPDSMSYEEAAVIPISHIIAYVSLMIYGNLRPGQILYVQTAAGGVGSAAIQIANTIPNVTIIGSASPSKHEFLYSRGLKHCFDSSKNARKAIKRLYPEGVDIIMVTVVGRELIKNRKLLKPLGRLIFFGKDRWSKRSVDLITGPYPNRCRMLSIVCNTIYFRIRDLIKGLRAECGINIPISVDRDPKRFREILTKVMALYDKGYIKPVIDSIWPFFEVRKGIARVIERKNIGNVVLMPDKIWFLNMFETQDTSDC